MRPPALRSRTPAPTTRAGSTCAAVLLAGVAGLLVPVPAHAASTVGAGTWENTSSKVQYHGSWKKASSSKDSGGSSSVLNGSGYAQLSFATTGVSWVARRDTSSGLADVYLDGVKQTRVDLYAKTTQVKQTVFEARGLPTGAHTLKVVRAGSRNPSSKGTRIQLDAFRTFAAPDTTAPATPTGLKASVKADDIVLTWAPNRETDVSAYRLYRREGTGGARTLVATTNATTRTATDSARLPGRTYLYDVVALDRSGNASRSSESVSVTLLVSAQGQGTYEDGSAAVGLRGAWSTARSSADSGGSHATLSSAGYAQISFSTSGIRWVARRDGSSGTAEVYLDGAKKATVDLYAATTASRQVVYEAKGLPETTHTLRVVWTGSRNKASHGTAVTLDAFVAPDVHAPAAPSDLRARTNGTDVVLTWAANREPDLKGYRVFRREDPSGSRTQIGTTAGATTVTDHDRVPGTTYRYDVVAVDTSDNASPSSDSVSALPVGPAQQAGTYEDGSSAVTLKGAWRTSSDGADSGGTHASLSSAGYAQVSFATSGIRWVTRSDASSGIADVYLDGEKKASVDLWSATVASRRTAYEVSGLPETPHVLTVVWTGAKRPGSSGSTVTLDAFVAPDVHAPATPTGLEAHPSGSDVGLSWSANDEPDLAGYRVYRRPDADADRVLVGTTAVGTTTLLDTGRVPGEHYLYDVVAVDTSGNASQPSDPVTATIAVVAEGAGTYENDSAAVTLDGPWSLIPSRMESGGSYSSLNAEGFAQVSFTTSGIRWVSRLNNYSGIADVYLDGVKQTSVDLYAPTTTFRQVVYEAKGLPETTHTLRIVRTGLKNDASRSSAIMLDAFVAPDVYPPSAPTGLVATPLPAAVSLAWTASPEPDVATYRVFRAGATGTPTLVASTAAGDLDVTDDGLQPGSTYRYQVSAVDADGNESLRSPVTTVTLPVTPLPAGTYQEDDPDVTLHGSWTRLTSGSGDSGGGLATLNSDGYTEITFGTSGIRWLARTNNYSGTADVYLDGVRKATVDLYSPTTKVAQTVFELKGLSETGHTLRVVRTGTKNAASTGRNVTLDAFVAPDVYAPSAPANVVAKPTRTGATVTWARSPEHDVAGYRVLRRADGSSTDVLVGTTDARTTSFTDVGLANAAAYSWRVVARDTSGNASAASAPADFSTDADPYAGYPYRFSTCPAATVTVANRTQLLAALASAGPGTVVWLKPGSYGTDYFVNTKATADAPLWICGPRSAVLEGGSVAKGYGIRFNGATNVVLAGMTVRNVQKGVSVQYSRRVTIADLSVQRIGDEAIHLKNQTTDSTVIGNTIDTTGLNAKNYGEGVYIGTAQGNWCLYNGCQPDTSDRDVVAFNDIRGNTAESIEAKAGTNDGTMWKNTLDGSSITADDADSLVQVMGSGWVIAGNVGSHSPGDAIQVWNTDNGSYGLDNIVYDNAVHDDLAGYVVRFPAADAGNVVGCDNSSAGHSLGTSNKTCQN